MGEGLARRRGARGGRYVLAAVCEVGALALFLYTMLLAAYAVEPEPDSDRTVLAVYALVPLASGAVLLYLAGPVLRDLLSFTVARHRRRTVYLLAAGLLLATVPVLVESATGDDQFSVGLDGPLALLGLGAVGLASGLTLLLTLNRIAFPAAVVTIAIALLAVTVTLG
jgi:hypothetical protein